MSWTDDINDIKAAAASGQTLDQYRAARANSHYWAQRNNKEAEAKGAFDTQVNYIKGIDTGIKPVDMEKLTPFDLGTKYKAKDSNSPEYASMRNDLISQNNAAKSDAMNALERKFAAMGNLNSGAYIKQSQIADQNYNQQAQRSLNDFNNSIAEKEAQREFQSQEAYNQRAFAASGQARQEAYQNFDNNTKLAALQNAWYQSIQNHADSQFNAEMAKYQAEHTGGLFGGGGFLGLGL